jgi:hypothetical protein
MDIGRLAPLSVAMTLGTFVAVLGLSGVIIYSVEFRPMPGLRLIYNLPLVDLQFDHELIHSFPALETLSTSSRGPEPF